MNCKNDNKQEQVRFIAWSQPRSLTTALMRSMESVPDVELFYEPFTTSAFLGPERFRRYLTVELPVRKDLSFQATKEKLEMKYEGKKVIFAKDFAFNLNGNYDLIPNGYKHIFLIRHPIRTFLSMYRVWEQFNAELACDIFKTYFTPRLGFQELHELYTYVVNRTGEEPLVLDTDDLLQNPKGILKILCDDVGLEFSESMLSWGLEQKVKWNADDYYLNIDKMIGFHGNSLSAGGFVAGSVKPLPKFEDLPEIVQEYVRISQP
ncbi:uncharacterized protein LOC117111202, partial [Anneissia japonica]|uniref:uncharacterized protein LOC117111202 n=1 Tax=Anneissia japonica TaxID=1529436 RepID=UPI001425760E